MLKNLYEQELISPKGGGRYSENYILYGNAVVVLTLPTPCGKGASKFFDGVGSVSADLGGMILATDCCTQ